jgi:hypothetical protein
MGVRFVAKGVDAEAYATEYAAPVRRALEGVFFTNGSAEKCARNYAPGKPSGAIVGAPVAVASYATFKGLTNYIQTQIAETESMTLFAIGKAVVVVGDPQQIPMFVGSYNTGVLSGVSIYAAGPTSIRGTAGYGNDDASNINASVGVATDPVSAWHLYSVTVTPTGVATRDHTSNLTLVGVNPGMPRRLAGRTIRLGSGYSGGIQGPVDLAAIQIHSAALTDDERNKTVADLRAYALRKGITV